MTVGPSSAIPRSVLSVPGSRWDMIQKALSSPADAVFLDLEDAVAPEAKPAARQTVARALAELDWHGRRRGYRINALDTPFAYRDLIEVVEASGAALDRIVVPKVNRPEDVVVVETLLHQLELATGLDHRIGLEVQIETAAGVVHCDAIAAASPRIEALVYGPGDFAGSVRMPSTAIGARDEWDDRYPGHRHGYVMQRILVAARAAGIAVYDGPVANFRDPDGYRASALVARSLGYDGKWCIHPSQIAIANEVFTPTEAELDWAERVVAAYEAATRAGQGAIALDNTMLDAASIKMAQAVRGRRGTRDT